MCGVFSEDGDRQSVLKTYRLVVRGDTNKEGSGVSGERNFDLLTESSEAV
jgi:hypothetical protein